jgi:ABC-type oligopeptide transport system substrate-binding subunit
VPTFETQPLERIALALQRQLFTAGVDLQLEQVSLRDLVTRLRRGDFESVLMEFYAATPSWLSSFWHSPPGGAATVIRSGYAAADKELEAMDDARTEDELRRALAEVYQKMAEDPPAVFIAWPEVARAVSTRFEVPVEKGRDIMGANLWLWRPARVQ